LQNDLLIKKAAKTKDSAAGGAKAVGDPLDALVKAQTMREHLYGLSVQQKRCDAVHDHEEYFDDLEAILG
jgi:hypothetical protein